MPGIYTFEGGKIRRAKFGYFFRYTLVKKGSKTRVFEKRSWRLTKTGAQKVISRRGQRFYAREERQTTWDFVQVPRRELMPPALTTDAPEVMVKAENPARGERERERERSLTAARRPRINQ